MNAVVECASAHADSLGESIREESPGRGACRDKGRKAESQPN